MGKMGKSLRLHLTTYWDIHIVAVLMLFIIVEGAVPDKKCSVSRCNDEGPAIHFPFWLKRNSSDQPPADDCAYQPVFQLSCGFRPGVRDGNPLYSKNNTLVEFQHLVNTSIKGLQLSFIYKATIRFIRYTDKKIYLYDTPYLTDIVPTTVLLNSSSTPYNLPFDAPTYYDPYSYSPFYWYNNYMLLNNDPFIRCNVNNGYNNYYSYDEHIRGYTFFNCSSLSSAVTEYNGNRAISSLSSRDYKVYAYASYDDTIEMLHKIKSCSKLYNISSKLPYFLWYCESQPRNYQRLSWSTSVVGGGKCEAVRESCKFEDEDRTTNTPQYFQPPPGGSGDLVTTKRLVAVLLPCIFLVVLGLIFLYNFIRLDKQKREKEDELKIRVFMENYKALKPTRYSYSDIKKITSMFKHKLGQGGYGSVFKGQISSDILVAVKVLHSDPKANGDDFINEVGTIGKIHHVNVVRLLGYCADGCNRALVYEFQPNHSLEKFVYRREKQQSFIGWRKMQKIALGIAKGIKYLHQGCAQQILHFDIKPNNILLDRNFNPKISDFGLAKLCNKGQSIVSMTAARGTIGYIAPEVFSRNFGNVSAKSDVYSFGMLLLEMVGGKDNNVEGEQNTSEVYFPEWIFKRLEQGGELVIQIENENDSKIARKLTIVGLWCIGWHPIDRPSMKLVIQMLEADECPAMPPNPFTSTTSASATHAKSFFSERLQVISEAE